MGGHARALASDAKRRPSYEEAIQFALRCGADLQPAPGGRSGNFNGVEADRIKTLACAYSEQWHRCGRLPPTD
jgi:hypothetical protein